MKPRLGDDLESGHLLLGGTGTADASVVGARVLTGGSGTPATRGRSRQPSGPTSYGQLGPVNGPVTARRQIP